MKPLVAGLVVGAAVSERRPTTSKVIAVVGAENPPGLGLIRAILEDLKGEFVARAIVRVLDSPESRLLRTMGADLAVADPRDEPALKRALAGAYGAFYIQLSSDHPSPETKLATAGALARAAKTTGLRHVVWATLEDPGQTFLEHNDVTPTFQNGRWISDGVIQKSPEQIFTDLAVPTTFLHTAWEPSVSAGKWTEDIGRHAYGILRDHVSIGQTVSISAARLIRRLTPPPAPAAAVPPQGEASPGPAVGAPPVAAAARALPGAAPPVFPEVRSPIAAAATRSPTRKIAVAGVVVALALVGLVILRQVQRQQAEPAREPTPTAQAPAPVPVAPVAIKAPEVHEPAPPPVAAPAESPSPTEVAPRGAGGHRQQPADLEAQQPSDQEPPARAVEAGPDRDVAEVADLLDGSATDSPGGAAGGAPESGGAPQGRDASGETRGPLGSGQRAGPGTGGATPPDGPRGGPPAGGSRGAATWVCRSQGCQRGRAIARR